MRVSFVHAVRRQMTMGPDGGRRFDSMGNVFVQVFGSLDVGVKALVGLCDKVRAVYEARRINGDEVWTYAGSSRPNDTDGRWAQRTVTIPFVYSEQR